MSSDKCANQKEWDLLMRKFDQVTDKYNFHCYRCEYHGTPREFDETRVCSYPEEYFRVVSFDEYWSEIYDRHVAVCELHQRFLEMFGQDVMEMFAEMEEKEVEIEYIN